MFHMQLIITTALAVLFEASVAKDCSSNTNSSWALKGNIVFLVDKSGSFGYMDSKTTLKSVKIFLNTMARWLSVRNESGELHAALVTFSDKVKVAIGFSQWNVLKVREVVSNIKPEGPTKMSKAIKKVIDLMDTAKASNNSKLVILITDADAGKDDVGKVTPVVKSARTRGIRFITLFANSTITNPTQRKRGMDLAENVISTRPDLFINIEDFDKDKIYEFVQSHICRIEHTLPPMETKSTVLTTTTPETSQSSSPGTHSSRLSTIKRLGSTRYISSETTARYHFSGNTATASVNPGIDYSLPTNISDKPKRQVSSAKGPRTKTPAQFQSLFQISTIDSDTAATKSPILSVLRNQTNEKVFGIPEGGLPSSTNIVNTDYATTQSQITTFPSGTNQENPTSQADQTQIIGTSYNATEKTIRMLQNGTATQSQLIVDLTSPSETTPIQDHFSTQNFGRFPKKEASQRNFSTQVFASATHSASIESQSSVKLTDNTLQDSKTHGSQSTIRILAITPKIPSNELKISSVTTSTSEENKTTQANNPFSAQDIYTDGETYASTQAFTVNTEPKQALGNYASTQELSLNTEVTLGNISAEGDSFSSEVVPVKSRRPTQPLSTTSGETISQNYSLTNFFDSTAERMGTSHGTEAVTPAHGMEAAESEDVSSTSRTTTELDFQGMKTTERSISGRTLISKAKTPLMHLSTNLTSEKSTDLQYSSLNTFKPNQINEKTPGTTLVHYVTPVQEKAQAGEFTVVPKNLQTQGHLATNVHPGVSGRITIERGIASQEFTKSKHGDTVYIHKTRGISSSQDTETVQTHSPTKSFSSNERSTTDHASEAINTTNPAKKISQAVLSERIFTGSPQASEETKLGDYSLARAIIFTEVRTVNPTLGKFGSTQADGDETQGDQMSTSSTIGQIGITMENQSSPKYATKPTTGRTAQDQGTTPEDILGTISSVAKHSAISDRSLMTSTRNYAELINVVLNVTDPYPANQSLGKVRHETTANPKDSGFFKAKSNQIGGIGAGATVGIILAILVIFLLVLAVIYVFVIRKKKKPQTPELSKVATVNQDMNDDKHAAVQASLASPLDYPVETKATNAAETDDR